MRSPELACGQAGGRGGVDAASPGGAGDLGGCWRLEGSARAAACGEGTNSRWACGARRQARVKPCLPPLSPSPHAVDVVDVRHLVPAVPPEHAVVKGVEEAVRYEPGLVVLGPTHLQQEKVWWAVRSAVRGLKGLGRGVGLRGKVQGG